MDAVKAGLMSRRKPASHFSVTKSTLHDRVSGKIKPGVIYGKDTVLPQAVEIAIAQKIKTAADRGFGISFFSLNVKGRPGSQKMKLHTPFRNGVPGRDWYNGFAKRNKLSLRTPSSLSTNRSRSVNYVTKNNYFDEVQNTISTLGFA